MVVSTPDWDYRRGFGTIGSYPAGTVIATLRENTGTLQHIGRLVSVDIWTPRSNEFDIAYRGKNGSSAVVIWTSGQSGTGRLSQYNLVDQPIAEIPAGQSVVLRAVQARGFGGRMGPGGAVGSSLLRAQFGIFTKSGYIGTVGPPST